MKFITDFHIHSHYSIATSKKLIPEYLDYWAGIKGINVIGTGDCIHPGWLLELKNKLEPVANGLFRLKKEYQLQNMDIPKHPQMPQHVYFMLTGEISSIYKKNSKVRKVHNICVFPDFEAVEKLQSRLEKIGNIRSDGRPILGLDSKDLLAMVLESSASSYLIPAHIWTPWFSVLGSKSGFDSLEECFEDLTPYIFAVETGLSSDPAMNRICSILDNFKLVSNSDAHSPEKLGREANLFDTDISYQAIYEALKGEHGFIGTIEFFPQEGKYHYDGHRKCEICWDPLETVKHGDICPVCHKPITKGVLYRVAELADRSESPIVTQYSSITQLADILAELFGQKSSNTKTVTREYMNLIQQLGSEFHILLTAEIDEIKKRGGELLAEGVRRLRNNEVFIEEGFDGQFGRVKLFNRSEIKSYTGNYLFSARHEDEYIPKTHESIGFDVDEFKNLAQKNQQMPTELKSKQSNTINTDNQLAGIEHFEGPCKVLAGPGSGKTRILTQRMIYLISQKNIPAENILAITFSNKAAEEIRSRVLEKLSSDNKNRDTWTTINRNISTFHALGLSILRRFYEKLGRQNSFYIIDELEKKEIINQLISGTNRDFNKKLRELESFKQGLETVDEIVFFAQQYDKELQRRNAFDLDDLIHLPVQLFHQYADILDHYRQSYTWILIDEYQDINAKQYELVRLIAADQNANLFVIGDPDQAIYGFRGSDIRFIDQLTDDYPAIKQIRLNKSYRCPDNVLKIGGQVLQRDHYLSGNVDKMKIHIQQCDTEKSEADWLAAEIEKRMGGVRSFSIDSGISDGESTAEGFADFAVLCRTGTMFEPIIKAFQDHGIAYQVIGAEPFYYQEPYITAMMIFRDIYYQMNPGQFSHKISNTLIKELQRLIQAKEDIATILARLMDTMDITEEERKTITNFAGDFAANYDSFFDAMATRSGADDYNGKLEAVSLMTLHASKGLEFNTVIIPGCEEGIIPFNLFHNKSAAELAEEERLFYVGVTRTKKNLILTYSKKRQLKGRLLQQTRSSYLSRLEKKLLYVQSREPVKTKTQLDLFS